MESIFSQIRAEASDFYDNYISIVPGYTFNQYNVLKRIHLYLNSQYEDGTQYLGRDKIFYNIVISPCEVAMRMLNLDTKNIRLLATNPKSYFSTYLLEKELKQWLKKNKLGKVLNQIAEEAPRYGSVVLQKTKDGAEVVDLRHLILDPTVDTIQKSRFVTTIHYLTSSELRETGWDNVEEAIEKFGSKNAQEPFLDQDGNTGVMTSTPYIKVTKRYGEVPLWWLDESAPVNDKMVKSLFIVAGADEMETNAEGKPIGEMGVVLFKSKWHKAWPFKDFHYTKIKGRWLGQGLVEMLFDIQVRINELKNQKRISMEISSMHLFQGPKSMIKNVFTDLQSGDYLTRGVNDSIGITPIANEERNLPAFDGEEASYLAHTDRLSFAYEAIRGQEPSSGTTLGQTQIQAANATSVYAFKKENLSLMYQDFFNDFVLDNLLRDLTPEHIMRFVGTTQEIEKLDRAAAEVYANDVVKEKILNGEKVYKEDEDAIKQRAITEYRKTGDSRFLKIKEALYDDVNFEFDFIITNEQEDLATKTQNYQVVMTALMQAAATGALQDPRVKLAFGKWAENMGISQAEFDLADQQATEQIQAQQQLQANQIQNVPAQPQRAAQPAPVAV